jgi:hypothetical protein
MSLDQVTSQELQKKLHQIKPQLQREYPELSERDFSQAEQDPDMFVSRIEQTSGQPRAQVEKKLAQLVGSR